VRFKSPDVVWQSVSNVAAVQADRWHRLELSWHPDRGIQVYADRKLLPMSDNETPMTLSSQFSGNSKIIVVGFSDDVETSSTTEILIDELSFWFADREQVRSFGYLDDGKCKVMKSLSVKRAVYVN
jgi:hypothetical protein